jgi:penicillin-binding protein 2
VAKAIVAPNGKVVKRIKPDKVGQVKVSDGTLKYIDTALLGTAKTGTTAWKFIDFPLDKVHIRSKTGSAEVHGKQSTSWVASYDKNYVVLMMVTQGGTGSGTSGPAVRKIWEALYGVHGMHVDKAKGLLPGAKPPSALPVFARDGEILPPLDRSAPSDESRTKR